MSSTHYYYQILTSLTRLAFLGQCSGGRIRSTHCWINPASCFHASDHNHGLSFPHHFHHTMHRRLAPHHCPRQTNQCLLLQHQPYLPIVLMSLRGNYFLRFQFQVFQDHFRVSLRLIDRSHFTQIIWVTCFIIGNKNLSGNSLKPFSYCLARQRYIVRVNPAHSLSHSSNFLLSKLWC